MIIIKTHAVYPTKAYATQDAVQCEPACWEEEEAAPLESSSSFITHIGGRLLFRSDSGSFYYSFLDL